MMKTLASLSKKNCGMKLPTNAFPCVHENKSNIRYQSALLFGSKIRVSKEYYLGGDLLGCI